VLDESHQTVPQLHGQYEGDRSRKVTLVDHGFRLPSAMDNRPLRFDEFVEKVNQVVFLSATPSPYELDQSAQVVEQIVRPTGLIDPEVLGWPTKGQIDDLVEIVRADKDQRILSRRHQEDGRGPHRISPRAGMRGATCTARSTRWSGWRSSAACAWAS
jgi:excinuclease ABC subunit B